MRDHLEQVLDFEFLKKGVKNFIPFTLRSRLLFSRADLRTVPRSRSLYFDAHCHLHEFNEKEIEELREYVIAAVSDDVESSKKTMKLAQELENVVPCFGIHPWVVDKASMRSVREIEVLVSSSEICCLGEVGLDKKFVPQTFSKQVRFFEEFVRMAVEYGVPLNVHAAGAWHEVYGMLLKSDVEKALLHWYTGPLDLLEELTAKGYFISINPAMEIQKKHVMIAMEVDLKRVLMESDSPYEYRGLRLTPKLIPKTLESLAKARGLRVEELKSIVESNFREFFGFVKRTF
jgi:TatD DNase family protein